MSTSILAFWCVLLTEAAIAAWIGGRGERSVAASYVIASAVSRAACPHQSCYASFLFAPALVDLALLAALLILVIRDPRLWLITSAALQLLTTLAYVAQLTDARLPPMAIFMTRVSSSWPALILLGWAVMTRWRRRQGLADLS